MFDLITPSVLTALFQVIMIDLVLAGDNAIVIGLAAAGLPKDQRAKVILIGVAAATVLRIIFALLTTQLLQIVGLLLAGGLLLLWVCWKMWRELRTPHAGDGRGGRSAEWHRQQRGWRRCGRRRRARPLRRRAGRSSLQTSRCRSTTCSPWPVPRATILTC